MNIKKPKFNLAWKFGILISVPVILVSLYVSRNYMLNSKRLIEETMIKRAKSIAKGLSLSTEYGLLIENEDILNKSIASYKNEKDIVYLSLINKSGKELVSYNKDQIPTDKLQEVKNDSLKPYAKNDGFSNSIYNSDENYYISETKALYNLMCNVTTVREKKSREDIGFLESDMLMDSKSTRNEGLREKIGVIQIGLSKSSMLDSLHRAWVDTIGLAFGAIVIVIVSTYTMVRLMVNPIKQLSVAVEKVSHGDFDYPVETRYKDEIGNLASSFNKMIVELKISREALQHRLDMERFVATISTDFINLAIDEIETNINHTLQSIGELLGVDQSYALLFSQDQKKIQTTYEWEADGIEQRAIDFKDRLVKDFLWGIEKISKFETIYVPRVADLPDEAIAEKESLQSYGIQSLLGVPLIYGGKLIGLLGLSSIWFEKAWLEDDITQLKMVGQIIVNALERKRSEETLQHQLEVEERITKELEAKTNELSRSNIELNSFVYTVSHDLKAPVVSLQGFSSLLMNSYSDAIDETGKLYINRIQKNSERMGTLIEDLLELSRIGRVKGQEQSINISSIISDVTNDLGSLLENRGTKMIVKGEMPTVYCDRTRIIQIFSNLISNANKFMGDDNNNPMIEVGYNDKNGDHVFYVKDNGIGIDKDYHEKIFQIFQRLEDIETEGTGVGLAIVKKIIENIGGKIWVDSAKGQGTTMYFTMPKEIEN